MKIGNRIPPIILEKAAEKTAKPGPEAAGKGARESSSKVSLSDKAQQMSAIKAELENVSDVRMDKVAQVKRAIEQGTYNPDSTEVAGALLQNHLIESLYR